MIGLSIPPELNGFQFSVCCELRREDGNDFLAFVRLPVNRLALIVADFLGFHPVPPDLKRLLLTEVERCLTQEADTGKAVDLLNTRMCRGKHDVRFINLMLLVFDARSSDVSVVNAGQHPPLVYRANTKTVRELSLDMMDLPLGFDEGIVGYEATRIRLCKDDMIAIYSDGIPEAANSQHQGFGVAAIKDLMREGGNVHAVRSRIMNAVVEHIGAEERDDMTLAVARRISHES